MAQTNVYTLEQRLKFDHSFSINLPDFYPVKNTWIPFFRELSVQISKQMEAITGISPPKKLMMDYSGKSMEYEGEPYTYINEYGFETVGIKHHGKFSKLHFDGYAYGILAIANQNLSTQMWIRWKSHLPDYLYIEPDDELVFHPGDVSFYICKSVPRDVLYEAYGPPPEIVPFNREVWSFLSKTPFSQDKDKDVDMILKIIEDGNVRITDFVWPPDLDYNSWIDVYKEYIKQRNGLKLRKKDTYFSCEICNGWPDLIMDIYFDSPVHEGTKNKTENVLLNFLTERNVKKGAHCIHSIAPYDHALVEGNCMVLSYHIDFGNCSPTTLKKFLMYISENIAGIKHISLH